jgi:hypothetical protein
MTEHLNKLKGPFQLPFMVFLGLCLLEVLAILYVNSGQFIYTLDDPYIHLRIAENIAQGHYGINLSENSAPSSSILWPFLLAPFAGFTVGEYVPLILNILASLGTVLMFAFISAQVMGNSWAAGWIATLLMLGTSLVGLTFTGMEHTVQVFLAVVIVAGLIVDSGKRSPPWWLLLATMVGPLIRYEFLIVTAATILYFICRRYYKIAFWCTVVTLSLLGGFSWFLMSLGLEGLPNSVLVKLLTHTDGGAWPVAIFKAQLNLLSRSGAVLVAGILLLIPVIRNQGRPLPERLLGGWAIIVTSGHLFTAPKVGQSIFLHFDRYDIYAVASLLAVLVYVYRAPLQRLLQTQSPIWVGCQAMVLLIFVSQPYLMAIMFTPIASNNIYEQQYQMQKFIKNYYRAPIAVNDLGLTTYGNSHYVLDLWGLGSLEALKARLGGGKSGAWMNRLAQSHDIQAAIIFDRWFPNVPQNWIRVATLHLSKYKLADRKSVV